MFGNLRVRVNYFDKFFFIDQEKRNVVEVKGKSVLSVDWHLLQMITRTTNANVTNFTQPARAIRANEINAVYQSFHELFENHNNERVVLKGNLKSYLALRIRTDLQNIIIITIYIK